MENNHPAADERLSPGRSPTLVLLPGMDGTGDLFAPFLAALDPDLKVQVIRYPHDPALEYIDLAEFVKSALPDGPFVLLGESFSGPVAISVAASSPRGLRGLILCCTFVRNPRPLFGWMRGMGDALSMLPRPHGMLSRILLGRWQTADLKQRFTSVMSDVSGKVMGSRLTQVLGIDVTQELLAVACPILGLQASDDLVVPAAAASTILQCRPDALFVRLPAPHFLLQATPRAAAVEVEKFVVGLDQAN